MRKRQTGNIALILTTLLLLCNAPSSARDISAADYPGNGNGVIVNVAQAMVSKASSRYYRVYGRFPSSWSELLDSGILDVELRGYQLQPMDPDDGSLDYPSDVYFENNKGQAFCHWLNPLTEQPHRIRLQFPSTYGKDLAEMSEVLQLPAEVDVLLRNYASDEQQLLQFAQLGLIRDFLGIYRDLHGNWPASMEQFMDSGLSPVGPGTLNPLTGQPYRYDCSAGDIRFIVSNGYATVEHVDGSGPLPVGIDY
ncbi:hypothetical protein KDL44_11985 [bacterium]|nr:hypothetical protein [bacterium]